MLYDSNYPVSLINVYFFLHYTLLIHRNETPISNLYHVSKFGQFAGKNQA